MPESTFNTPAPGESVARLPSAANSDNPTLVKAGKGTIHHINGQNAAAAVRYLKIYDKATAPAAADTPLLVVTLAASLPFTFSLPNGLRFANGLGYRLVTGAADNDNTAVTAADILQLHIIYR